MDPGTQRLKVGQRGGGGGPKGRQLAPPSGGTKRLKTSPGKQNGPGRGTQSAVRKDPNTVPPLSASIRIQHKLRNGILWFLGAVLVGECACFARLYCQQGFALG